MCWLLLAMLEDIDPQGVETRETLCLESLIIEGEVSPEALRRLRSQRRPEVEVATSNFDFAEVATSNTNKVRIRSNVIPGKFVRLPAGLG